MKIDLVFPRFKLLSGAERLILGLAEALQRAGHHPRIVCHQFDDSCRPRLAPGVDLVCSGKRLDWFRNRYLNAIFDYGRTRQLNRLLESGADAHVLFGPALPLGWRRRRLENRPPILYFCYEPPRALYQDREVVLQRLGALRFLVGPLMSVYRRVDKRFVAVVDRVCTNSDFSASRIKAAYGRTATVITHGVDNERFDAARRPVPDGPPVVLTVNYLHPRKRVDLAIRAVAALRGAAAAGGTGSAAGAPGGAGSSATPLVAPRLHIIGDGPERDRLEALAKELEVGEQVRFLGFVDDKDLPVHYWTATTYLHTAKDESLGLSVVEAAYCARPLVAVAEGGVTQTVRDEQTGFLVEPTADAVAEGLAKLLALADRGAQMGEMGRQRIIEMFSWDKGAEDLLQAVRTTTAGVSLE